MRKFFVYCKNMRKSSLRVVGDSPIKRDSSTMMCRGRISTSWRGMRGRAMDGRLAAKRWACARSIPSSKTASAKRAGVASPDSGAASKSGSLAVLESWRGALVEILRRAGPDLSTRQMGILLTVYLVKGPHSVRGLAGDLSISKPAVSRALDRLGDLGFIRRVRDMGDHRKVLVERTVAGSVFLSEFADVFGAVSSDRT